MKRHVAVCLGIATSCVVLSGCSDEPVTTTSSSSTASSSSSGSSSSSSGSAGAGGEAGGGQGGGAGTGGAGGMGGSGGGGGAPVAICGDGAMDVMEQCDDGNDVAGDGCDAMCFIEAGHSCSGVPSVCTTSCGDGIIAGAEQCDDKNSKDGDGCNASCAQEVGYTCTGSPSACVTTCGDGFVAGVEKCDDGATVNGDGCTATCGIETGYACTGQPSVCAILCGDGLILGAEGCDDNNTAAGDGCSAACAIESGFVCVGMPSVCATICGDGIAAGAEMCDDGAAVGGDGCSDICAVENGFTCTGTPSSCVTTCGDQIIAGAENCDDGNANAGDGCSATCAIESGFTCMNLPSVCVTTCGDGIAAGTETCDDGAKLDGDGCAANCSTELGFTCSGVPSVCVTTCGDGIVAGSETCDDGNQINGDGCNTSCTASTGESCADTIAMSQANVTNGTYTWSIPSNFVTTTDGDFACDPNTQGPDVVIAYVKTSDTLANGGQLLHVFADTPTSTSTANFLNVEVTDSCVAGMAQSLKCLWYKDNWDVYLDVPPGTYYLWVQKNSPGTFPAATVVAEEVDPIAAEGEGCFAPYTSSSAIYTPPAGSGLPHRWTLPPSINSFDMGPTWGEPGSISCDNNVTYGDIHGVDAVIEFDKQSATSVLSIQVQNFDPVPAQSDLNVEVLNVCDALDPTKISRHCRANLDTISITAPSPAGPVYLWVSSEATGEEFQGATVNVTEIFPGIGESWPTAQPLMGSSSIVATSTQRLDAPTCFPAGTNIHWFSYTLTNDVLSLLSDKTGRLGVYDEHGQELLCVADASIAPSNIPVSPGKPIYIAIESPTVITSLDIADLTYTGVGKVVTDMNITFISSATADTAMATNGTQIVLSDTSKVFAFPAVAGSTAVEYGTGNGITTAHLGYDTIFVGSSLFSVDSATTTAASRLFRIYDGVTWGPGMAWDLTPTYAATSPTYALATDGTDIYMMSRRTTGTTDFYRVSATGASTPVLLGTAPGLWYGVGLAVDNQYFYVAGNGTGGEGVYRVSRMNIAGTPKKLATLDTSTTGNGIEVDSFSNPQYLYVREYGGDTHAIVQPASATPAYAGVINALGTVSDYGMTYDKAAKALYIFETETVSTGRIVKLE